MVEFCVIYDREGNSLTHRFHFTPSVKHMIGVLSSQCRKRKTEPVTCNLGKQSCRLLCGSIVILKEVHRSKHNYIITMPLGNLPELLNGSTHDSVSVLIDPQIVESADTIC